MWNTSIRSMAILLVLAIAVMIKSCVVEEVDSGSPKVTTKTVSDISGGTAKSGGSVTEEGTGPVTARGVVWGTKSNPEINLSTKTKDGDGLGTFTSSLTGLSPNTSYFVRAYATNSKGTAYGNEVTFSTPASSPPAVSTLAASGVTATAAVVGGNVTSEGSSPVTSRGIAYGTSATPTVSGTKTSNGIGSGSFSGTITGLTPNTKYFARAYATNTVGTAYGSEIDFTTTADVPDLTTTAVTSVGQTTASSGGNVTDDGGASVTARGVVWGTSPSPTVSLSTKTSDGTGKGSFTSAITGLSQGTKYYLRSYATNSAGTGYGSELSFTTSETVTDINGNTYTTVTIGTQTWLSSNLKATKYNDNTAIPNQTVNATWGALTSAAYSDHGNNSANVATYGRLYNYYVVESAKNVCPTGWHVPSKAEWETLRNFVSVNSGKKLKGTGTWSPFDNGTNDFGFNAVGSSYRNGSQPAAEALGAFGTLKLSGELWAKTVDGAGDPYYFSITNNSDNTGINNTIPGKKWGFAIRCLKN